MDAARSLLRSEFGSVKVDAVGWRIVTRPEEYATPSDSGTARDLYGGISKMRRTATLVVSQRGDGSVARLRIDLEREDSSRRAILNRGARPFGDAPGTYTAIDRDAATSAEQNKHWTFVKRDLRLERELLDALHSQLAPSPQPASDAAP